MEKSCILMYNKREVYWKVGKFNMWIFLCLLSAVTSGLASIIMKKCSKNNNPKSIALIGLATSNILYIIVSILFTDVLTNFSIKNFLQIAPLTMCQMIGYICGILSVKYASVSTVIPIRKCNTIVTLVLGILILNESIPILKLILSLILVILTILIVKEDKITEDKDSKKGIIFAWLFVLFNGVSSMLNKYYISTFVNPLVVTFYYSLFGLSIVVLYCFFTKSWKCYNLKNINKLYMLFTYILFDFVSNLSYRFCLVDGQVSLAQPIHSSSIIITIIGSYFILKEKISKRKWLMIAGVIICVMLLSI